MSKTTAIVIILIILALIGGYLIYKQMSAPQEIKNTTNSSSENTPTSDVDVSSDNQDTILSNEDVVESP